MTQSPDPHIGFVTAVAPTGMAEAFVLAELAFLKQAGLALTVAPVRLEGPVFHERARELESVSVLFPLLDASALYHALVTAATRPLALARAVTAILLHSGSARATVKNLACLPKACRLARDFRHRGITHVHGAWASVPATVAWLIGRLLDVPWSFTAIRWDVDEANLLGPKIREAAFIRATSEGAKQELLRRSGLGPEYAGRISVIPHGVPVGAVPPAAAPGGPSLRILSVGFLVPKKGHRFLIEACRLLRDRGVPLQCTILGSGPLQQELGRQITDAGLEGTVLLEPFVPQAQLMTRLSDGSTDLLVYPSIVAEDGQREGIPVTLVETLALGVPVLSTPTGDISELLGEIPSALVAPGDAGSLADRLEAFARDRTRLAAISQEGWAVVARRFDMTRNIGGTLRALLSAAAPGPERGLQSDPSTGRLATRMVPEPKGDR